MKKFLKEPLLHFLLGGIGLFVLFEVIVDRGEDLDARVIQVNRETLLTFAQFRMRSFEPSVAAEKLDAMSAEELEQLVKDFVREEALHREAKALGMDKNDYIIKRRMIQSIEFITNGFVTAAVDVSDEEVQQFFEANREDYFIAPFVTFTHVYFSTEDRNHAEVAAVANEKLVELNKLQVTFGDAPQHGDRFPYFVNYVERGPEFVASHFGEQMTDSIFALEPDESAWHGPFQSQFGFHLVKLTRKADGRQPVLDELIDRVREDAKRAAVKRKREEAIQTIVDSYEVRRSL